MKRLRTKVFAAALALMSAPSFAAPAAPVVPMAPSGPWNVEFADSMCVLSRPYKADHSTILAFKPAMVGDSLEVIVSDSSAPHSDLTSGKATLAVAGEAPITDASFTAYSTKTTRLVRINLSADSLRLGAVRDTIAIGAKPETQMLFAIPGIERALPVVADCLDQLRDVYKINKDELAAIVTQPLGSPGGFFSTKDYPREAAEKEQSGTVGVLYWVETTGRVSSCQVIEASAPEILQKTTCDVLMRRARFAPALNAARQPVRAPGFYRLRWALP